MIEGFSEDEIKLYLKGKATVELSERIESVIANDDELAQLIQAGRLLSATAEREAIKKEISQVHEDLKKEGFFDKVYEEINNNKKTNSNFFRLYIPYIAAASILSIVFLLYFVFFSQKDLFRHHYTLLPDQISHEIELIAGNRNNPHEDQKYSDILQAMKHYNDSEYRKAVDLLKSGIRNEDMKFDKRILRLYLAVSEIQLKKYSIAIDLLREISDEQSFKYHNDVIWNLSYSLYKSNKKIEAASLLKKLTSDQKYGNKAKEILSGLN